MAKQIEKETATPIVTAAIVSNPNPKEVTAKNDNPENLYAATGGLLKFSFYKPEAKSFSKGHHFTFGMGAAYLDFIPGGATYRGITPEKALITNEAGKARIIAYAKEKGYAAPSFEPVK